MDGWNRMDGQNKTDGMEWIGPPICTAKSKWIRVLN